MNFNKAPTTEEVSAASGSNAHDVDVGEKQEPATGFINNQQQMKH